jgi:hypothetical protein
MEIDLPNGERMVVRLKHHDSASRAPKRIIAYFPIRWTSDICKAISAKWNLFWQRLYGVFAAIGY